MKENKIRLNTIVTIVLALVLFITNIRNISILNGPYMFNDELGYLGNAAAFAGKDWHYIMQRCAWYSYGWSMIISPLFMIFSNMQIIYRCINILNALLVVSVFLMQRHILMKMFTAVDSNILTAISACVCSYPYILVNSSMAWCEIWLLFTFTAITLFLYYMIQYPKTYKVFIWGVMLYYFYVCHNRMVSVVIAGSIVFLVLCLIKKYKKKDIFFYTIALLASHLIFGQFKEHLISLNWRDGLPSGNDMASGIEVFKNLLSLEGLKNFVSVICSQFIYICTSTYGLVPFGLFVCILKIVSKIKNKNINDVILEIWLTLSFLGTFAISTIAVGAQMDISSRRVDHIFYGRYYEPVCILILAYGISNLLEWIINIKRNMFYSAVYFFIVGLCTTVSFFIVGNLNNPQINAPNVSGIYMYARIIGNPIYFIFIAALFGLIGFTIMISCLSSKRKVSKYVALVGFFAVNLLSTHSTELGSIIPNQDNYAPNIPFVNAIRNYDTGDLPIYSFSSANSYFQCMLTDNTLNYTRGLSINDIPDNKFYAIVSLDDYYRTFEIPFNVIAHSKDHLFIFVDRNDGSDAIQKPIFLEMMHLKENSTLESDHIHVDSHKEALAFYGPYIALEKGSYALDVDIQIQGGENLDSYGSIQVYSASQNKYYEHVEITKDMLANDISRISIPFHLDSDINDLEIYLRTKRGLAYDVYNISLKKSYIYDYPLNIDNIAYDLTGFSHYEPAGRWITDNNSKLDCYLPADDYTLILDLGYSIPLDKLNLSEYSAEIYINDIYLGELIISSDDSSDLYYFDIAEGNMMNGNNTVSIKCDQLWSPSEYGSQDSRMLGICVESISFAPAA